MSVLFLFAAFVGEAKEGRILGQGLKESLRRFALLA
jgi:hypothetical protein